MSIRKTKPQAVTWTAVVRITHWLVALFVLVNFFNESGFWHRFIGYFCLALVIARVSYGLWLSKDASSKFYMPTIVNIKHHIHEIRSQSTWAVSRLSYLDVTGWLSRTDAYWGEDWPVDLPMVFSNMLQGLVILHIAAVVLMSKLQKKNLLKQMISGKPSDTTR